MSNTLPSSDQGMKKSYNRPGRIVLMEAVEAAAVAAAAADRRIHQRPAGSCYYCVTAAVATVATAAGAGVYRGRPEAPATNLHLGLRQTTAKSWLL